MITIPKNYIHFAFDPHVVPCATAYSGDIVSFSCQDCYSEQIVSDGIAFSQVDMKRNNPATGPLYVNDAAPGDILRVEILDIALGEDGCMTAREGVGTYEIHGTHCRRFPLKDGSILFDRGIRIPLKPMVGVVGTAPAKGTASTQVPGRHGGNLDIKDLGPGAFLYLPVDVEGALLSIGDIHAVQGDGETVICALETSGVVRVKINVLKGRNDIPLPFIVTPDRYLSVAVDPSLDICSVQAARTMHRFLMNHSGLRAEQCGMLLSLAGNLRISQIVNPSKGCVMEFPRFLIGERFEL
ncbi:MAG: amidase [Spirochaetes bacterium]|nr:MAG: amidase [Spirochaetota bacterium]